MMKKITETVGTLVLSAVVEATAASITVKFTPSKIARTMSRGSSSSRIFRIPIS